MTRILRVGIQQGIRTLTLILLPIAFISLVAWATAGSSSGNTADPLRAALWFFLALHQVPLQLSLSDATLSGSLTFLPVGGLLIPFFATRSGYLRMVETLGEPNHRERRSYILALSTSYSLIGYLFVMVSLGETVRVAFYIAIPILFIVSAISAFLVSGALPKHAVQFPWQRALRIVWMALIALLGFSSIALSASLIYHFEVVLNLTRVIEPGIFGGLVLLIGQLMYLPNISVATLSYFSGAGISIGEGSLLSPFSHRIDEIPAIPLLGALPVTNHLYLISLSIITLGIGAAIANYGAKTYSDVSEEKRFYISSCLISLALFLAIARASSGQLLSANLPSVGPIWWALPIVITAQFALGGALFVLAPKVLAKLKR